MTVRTKKYRLTPSLYVRIGLWNIFRKQWWIGLIAIGLAGGLAYFTYVITAVVSLVLLGVYILFWWSQFYGLTKMEDNKVMFERLFYELNKERVIIFLSTKQGMPIDWKQIQYARVGRDYFVLFISMAQFIYLPHGIFQGEQQIDLVRMLLKHKKLV